jgi:MFS transporter, AAHS family, 4-hydroxybenzoate transporter
LHGGAETRRRFPEPPPGGILRRQAVWREANMAHSRTINVSDIIDGSRFGAFQWSIAIGCAVLVTLDGFDNSAINFVAPTIVREWHLAAPTFGPIFGAGLFGLMLGALGAGPIADRRGRKIVILASTIIFAIFALATTLARSIDQLYVLRFLTGIGVGGLMPNSIALTAEYAPKRIRATVVAIMFLGFPLGAGAGGFIGAVLIPAFGWQAMFVMGGLLPLALTPVIYFALPESIRFLVNRDSRPGEVALLLNRLARTSAFNGSETFVMPEGKPLPGFTAKHLLTEGRAVNTTLLWLAFFCNLLVIYSIASWLPLLLHDSGVPLGTALRLGGMVPWAGIVSTVILGPLVDRLGATGVVTVLYTLAAGFIFAIGLAGADVSLLTVTIVGCGMCVIGGQSFINVLSAVIYPTSVRSTAVGWALGVGRVGAIVGPVVGGLLLAAHITSRNLFFTISVPSLVAAFAMLLLGLRLRRLEPLAAASAARAQ